jgi:putative phage-type endonuclease
MLTQAQLQARKVGGSEVAVILGMSPFKTELELYHEKIGSIPPVDLSENEAVAAGNLLEDGIADLTAWHLTRLWKRDVKLRRCNRTLVHKQYDWLTAHIDREVVGDDRGLEIKNVGPYMARGWGAHLAEGGVPTYILPQVHHYLLVTDRPVWTVSAYMGGREIRLYEVERAKTWDELIIEQTHNFWHNHVLAGVPPDADTVPAERRLEVAQRIYPGTTGEFLEADTEELQKAKWKYERACAEAAAQEKLAKLYKGDLLMHMGEAAILAFPDGTQLVRKRVHRKAYMADAVDYIDSRFKKPRKSKDQEQETADDIAE